MALFHLLLICQRWFKFELHVAHVDHGWRSESREEAQWLQAQVSCPFYLHRLEGVGKDEASAREERLKFFSQLYEKLQCQALLLGHQAEDQAETVLKRIFEGGGLFTLRGITPVTHLHEMVVWRPLLGARKQELIAWLEQRGIPYLQDPSNYNPKYLRAKMRMSILPELSKSFGKEIQGNLLRLGQTAQELKEYFDKKLIPYFEQVTREEGGVKIDLNPLYPFEKVELKVFLKHLSEVEELGLSYEALETLAGLLEEGNAPLRQISCRKKVEVSCRKIAIKSQRGY
jgi:tRNA(Ile)-lysidine synthase